MSASDPAGTMSGLVGSVDISKILDSCRSTFPVNLPFLHMSPMRNSLKNEIGALISMSLFGSDDISPEANGSQGAIVSLICGGC